MPDFSESFVASIALALNAAQILCVLWGHYLLNVHGVPSIMASIDFVIPDNCLSAGTEVLTRFDGLVSCPDSEACSTSSQQRPSPPPAFHTHLKDLDVTVSLYLQSETLWSLMPLDRSLASPTEVKHPSCFVFASNQTILPPWRPGRGSGFFKPSQYPLIVPKSHILLDAFMLLYARDFGKRMGAFAMPMIGYIEEYVDEDGLLETKQLPEPLLTFYRELREGEKTVRQWTKQLREALGLSGDSRSETETEN